MKRSYRMIGMMLVVFTFFLGGLAFGDSCPRLVGEWDVTSESVAYSPSDGSFIYVNSAGILHIVHQNGCLFYGSYERTDSTEPVQPLTGAIGPASAITMTGSATLVQGNLVGPRRIDAIVSNLEIPLGSTVNTSRATAIKR
jgi:hypothetical protein